MEALAYAHSYEAYERGVGIEVNLSERLWHWRVVPSAFGLRLLALAALAFLFSPPDLARANSELLGSGNDALLTQSSPEEPPRAAELREELQQLSQQKTDFFFEGTNAAAAAAELAKTAKTEAEWNNVEKFWQQAIAAMQSVPQGDRDFALAQQKISEYQTSLDTARQKPQAVQPSPQTPPELAQSSQQPPSSPRAAETPLEPPASKKPEETVGLSPQQPDFFYEGTNAAAAAAELAKMAKTEPEWNNVEKFWQQAIAAMESVPKGDRDFALAQQKISEYQANLERARQEPETLPPQPADRVEVRPSPPAPTPAETPASKPLERKEQPPSPVAEPAPKPAETPASKPPERNEQPPSPVVEPAPKPAETPASKPPERSEQPPSAVVEPAPKPAETPASKPPERNEQPPSPVAEPAPKPAETPVSKPPERNEQPPSTVAEPAPKPAETPASKPPERNEQPPSTVAEPAPESPDVALPPDFFYEGANAAAAAAELAKMAKTEAEWNNVAKFWQQAIAAMESVPKGDRDYALAQQKISEYRANLEAAKQQRGKTARSQPAAPSSALKQPQTAESQPPKTDYFYEGANAAVIAAQLAQTAKTPADWDKVEQAWQKAIAAMKSVPKGDRDYPLAQQKLQEYEGALKYAKGMPDDFSQGIQAATQAVELGKNAKTQSEWQSVAQNWQRAIVFMKAVPPGNPQFELSSQKIIEYEYYLDSIKEKLQSAISPMTFKKAIRGNLSPKSIVYSGRGKFFVQNMMYGHTIAVYNQQYELIRTLSDSVKLSDFGYKDYSGTYRGAPVEAAFSHGGQYAWVSNYQMYGSGFGNPGDDRCSPEAKHDPSFLYRINTDTINIEKVIKVGSVPKYVAATPDNQYILASNWCSWDLSVVDPEKNQEIRRIPLGAYPRGIAIDSNSTRAYVAVMGSSNIAVVNLKNFSVDWIKNVGAGPRHLNLSPDNRYLYASLNSEGTVVKIDLSTNEWQKVRTGNAPRSMVLSADGQFLYVVNYFSNTVSKVRTSDLKVLQSLPTDTHPIGITYDPDTKQVWVVCYSGSIMIFQD